MRRWTSFANVPAPNTLIVQDRRGDQKLRVHREVGEKAERRPASGKHRFGGGEHSHRQPSGKNYDCDAAPRFGAINGPQQMQPPQQADVWWLGEHGIAVGHHAIPFACKCTATPPAVPQVLLPR